MGEILEATAVILSGPRRISLEELTIAKPGDSDIVVDIAYSGISTGTEKLFWDGSMPPFPGMGYPLVPGYEATGEVVEAGSESGFRCGDTVFVPGANCYQGARGLFGGASSRLVTAGERAIRIDRGLSAEGALLALAATAFHAVADSAPDLIIGHGVLGRLMARIQVAKGKEPPTVWEIDPSRMAQSEGYQVVHPEDDERRDYAVVCDASGAAGIIDQVIARMSKGGEIVLAGFYPEDIRFSFPPAFMREMRLRVAAEWTPSDLEATRDLVSSGALSLANLITHTMPAAEAASAYPVAFQDATCLKMILDWS